MVGQAPGVAGRGGGRPAGRGEGAPVRGVRWGRHSQTWFNFRNNDSKVFNIALLILMIIFVIMFDLISDLLFDYC